MGDKSAIEWTDATLNPIRARNRKTGKVGWFCMRVSEGCRNCYASTMNEWRGSGVSYEVPNLRDVEMFLDEKMLDAPRRWLRPRRIFLCSMTDLFGEWVSDDWLRQIFEMMYDAREHTFQILTKRPDRMLAWCSHATILGLRLRDKALENVWLGVSVEDQATADERIPLLLQTPDAVRWVSYEPALVGVDFRKYVDVMRAMNVDGVVLNWLVIGGESGPGARPFDLAWARSAIAQGRAAGVPVFCKQLGTRPEYDSGPNRISFKLRDSKGGDWGEWPEDLRMREWPT